MGEIFDSRSRSANNVENFILEVDQVERLLWRRSWSAEDVVNACRKTRYDGDTKFDFLGIKIRTKWDALIVRDNHFPGFGEVDGGSALHEATAGIKKHMDHSPISGGHESGVVMDQLGHRVAIGHAVTGICAGLRYNASATVEPLGLERMDNVLVATIAGDFGQIVSEALLDKDVSSADAVYAEPQEFGGIGHEATTAELVGDIDGVLLGYAVAFESDIRHRLLAPMKDGGMTLSSLLRGYYCPGDEPSDPRMAMNGVPLDVTHRFEIFSGYYNQNAHSIADEAMKFAHVYSLGQYKADPDLEKGKDYLSLALTHTFPQWYQREWSKDAGR